MAVLQIINVTSQTCLGGILAGRYKQTINCHTYYHESKYFSGDLQVLSAIESLLGYKSELQPRDGFHAPVSGPFNGRIRGTLQVDVPSGSNGRPSSAALFHF
jgi:hypothetical protein